MLIWSLCFFTLFLGLKLAAGDLAPIVRRNERALLTEVSALFQEIEETLAAGLVPDPARWAALQALPSPWGGLAFESLQELRSSGGALLPTLRRLRNLSQEHSAALTEARARSSQALAQALVCAALVPAFGSALYWLLPGLDTRAWFWWGACAVSVALAALGAFWMLVIADRARWAGLSPEARPWVLASQCAGERFLALVRSGSPADLAWARAHQLLQAEAPGLAERWGASVWTSGSVTSVAPSNGAERALEEAGSGLRKAVQVSLMEGRPCTERVETTLMALRQDLRSLVERELGLLTTRALKPLFACVAPALFLLLGLGLWLSFEQAGAVL